MSKRAQPLFLTLLFVSGAVFIYLWLAGFGNTPQVFTDVVEELTSAEGSNKSAEQNMVYLLSIIGASAVFLFYLFYNKTAGTGTQNPPARSMNLLGLIIFTAFCCSYLIYGVINPVLFALSAMWVLLCICSCAFPFSAMISFVMLIYAFCGLYRAYVYLGGSRDCNIGEILLASFAITGILIYASYRSKKDLFLSALPFIQLFIPLSLLIYLSSGYVSAEGPVNLAVPRRISLFVWLVIIFFMILSLLKLKNSFKKNLGADELISLGSICCIMNFNSYSGLGQIVSADLHHPFENIIAFSQIFELGQAPFAEYIPVSGLYSVLQGAFLFVFGKGFYAYYNVCENLFYLMIAVMIVFAASKLLKNSHLIIIALLFPLLRYNRIALILPIMLLLSIPALIKKRSLWIKLWFLSSLVQGLYYPLFGAAVCIAFMPMLLYQLINYAKEDLKKDIRKPLFWLGWIITLLPAVLCIPLLLGTLKHMLAMSSQTVFADGLSRFGQGVPDQFFAYIHSDGLRIFLYDLFSFLIPVSVIWVSVILAMKLGGVSFKDKKLRAEDPGAALLCITPAIAMLISFSYTLVRMDVYDVYSRSAGMIFASAVMFLVIAQRYRSSTVFKYLLSAFSVFLTAAVLGISVCGIDSSEKLTASYTVPEGYIQTADPSIPRLGNVFIRSDVYDKLCSRREKDAGLTGSESYLGLGEFGYFYLYNIKGGSVMEVMTIRGYNAAKETVDILRKNKTVVGVPDSFAYYYLYKWMLSSGEYSWSWQNRKFYPADKSPEEVYMINKTAYIAHESRELGLTPSSWGLSMDSLEGLFTECSFSGVSSDGSEAVIDLGTAVKGEDADFLYLEFDNSAGVYDHMLSDHIFDMVYDEPSAFAAPLMRKDHNPGKTVIISWVDDDGTSHDMNCSFGQGKLLIPLGSGSGWLLNSHGNISIRAGYYEEQTALETITKCRLLKLREVE
ncbi:MAG: hypothetical protein J6X66_09265 [Lachnospiraceae bacterium]|nr:hypothetical protein [Lachnospiraceae bacterium]